MATEEKRKEELHIEAEAEAAKIADAKGKEDQRLVEEAEAAKLAQITDEKLKEE